MPVSSMYRVTTLFTGVAGAPWYVTGYFDSAAGTASQAITAWHAFASGGPSNIPLGIKAETQAVVPIIDPSDGELVGVAVGTPLGENGSRVGELLPLFTQGLMRWNTGFVVGGRLLRGRTNLPGFVEGDSDGLGRPTSTIQAAINTRATTLLGAATADFVVWSKKNGVAIPANAASMSPQWGVLRSRRD